MSAKRRLLLKNFFMVVIALILIIISFILSRNYKIHTDLLIIGILIIGWSGDGILRWIGESH